MDNSSCTLTSGTDTTAASSGIFSAGTRKRHALFAGTFTNSGNASDTVDTSGEYTGTERMTKKGGDLAKASVSGTGSVSVDAALGANTDCGPSVTVEATGEMQFTEHHSGWLYLERTTPAKQGFVLTQLENSNTNAAVLFEIFFGGQSHALSRAFVKPGVYEGSLAIGLSFGAAGPFAKAASSRTSASVTFHKSGSALGRPKGAGKAYVELPGSVSCDHHKATLRWKASASHVASAAFFVNGKKKATDATPRGGEKIVLKHLKARADIKIAAKLQLKGGGSATATRTYVPCKG